VSSLSSSSAPARQNAQRHLLFDSVAFALFAFFLAETGSANGKVDFATMGAPVAYAVLILSWLVTMLGKNQPTLKRVPIAHPKIFLRSPI
jgi:hypothetical protein